jgi:hypothetical protein
MFLILMVIGLVGLAMMAIPAFGRHHAAGHGHTAAHGCVQHGTVGHAHGVGHAAHGAGSHGPASQVGGAAAAAGPVSRTAAEARDAAMDVVAPGGVTRFLPSPRAVLSVLALYGAFGNALVQAARLPVWVAAVAALLPALLVERWAVTPLWNMLFRFQGDPSAPLSALLFREATAVTPFRNGKGLVSVVRDGRLVQLAARLSEAQAGRPVGVGDRLVVEEVDPSNERLTVSVPE